METWYFKMDRRGDLRKKCIAEPVTARQMQTPQRFKASERSEIYRNSRDIHLPKRENVKKQRFPQSFSCSFLFGSTGDLKGNGSSQRIPSPSGRATTEGRAERGRTKASDLQIRQLVLQWGFLLSSNPELELAPLHHYRLQTTQMEDLIYHSGNFLTFLPWK